MKEKLHKAAISKGTSLNEEMKKRASNHLLERSVEAQQKILKEFAVGQKYNRLTSTGKAPITKNGQYEVEMVCECGIVAYYNVYKIKTSHTKSCGCFKKEVGKSELSNPNHPIFSELAKAKFSAKKEQSLEKSRKTRIQKYGAWESEEIIQKRKQTIIEKFGVNSSLKSPEVRARIRNTLISKYGVENPTQCNEILKKASVNVNNSYKVEHNGEIFFCRATWELGVTLFLINNNIVFQKEPKTFQTPHGYYTPDFFLPEIGLWIEVKGFFRDDGKLKWDWFHKNYPNSELWDKAVLIQKGIINNSCKINFDPLPYKVIINGGII